VNPQKIFKTRSDQDARNKMLSNLHDKFRKECIEKGTYKPITEEELEREIVRWRKLCETDNRPVRNSRKRKKK
jgi:hypothetical protein